MPSPGLAHWAKTLHLAPYTPTSSLSVSRVGTSPSSNQTVRQSEALPNPLLHTHFAPTRQHTRLHFKLPATMTSVCPHERRVAIFSSELLPS